MSLDFLNEYLVPIVIASCLVIGYCIKQIDKIPNNIIPTVLAIIGAIVGCIDAGGISLKSIVYGAISGLASTGIHQLFKQWIERDDSDA